MNSLYMAIGTTKQNVHQRLDRLLNRAEEARQMEVIIHQVRKDHPGMGMRQLYTKLQPDSMGRDRFYAWYRQNGFTIKKTKNWRRTTDSSGVIRFPNKVEGKALTGVNQVWVSDITYYDLGEKFFYLTFIMDQYSRMIKGYSVSKTLKTVDTTIPALEQALPHLRASDRPIIHSDGGGQYYCQAFLKLTKDRFINSMGVSAYENPYAERLNGTIKNQYLKGYRPTNYLELTQMTAKAVKMYNDAKPHDGLGGLTPKLFEQNELSNDIKIDVKPYPKTVNSI